MSLYYVLESRGIGYMKNKSNLPSTLGSAEDLYKVSSFSQGWRAEEKVPFFRDMMKLAFNANMFRRYWTLGVLGV